MTRTGAPSVTSSPERRSQRASLALSIVKPSFGIVISIMGELLSVEYFFGSFDDITHLRENEVFKHRAEGNGNILCTDPHDRRIEIIKELFSDSSRDFGTEAPCKARFVDNESMISLFH